MNRDNVIRLLLVIVTCLVYLPVRNYEFVNYDDNLYVSENSVVQRGLTVAGIVWAFRTNHASNWHPVTWLSHMLDCQLFGPNAGAHHLVNVVFHIANTLLLFAVLKRITAAAWPSAFVAALFALHPLHVESVAWVSERKDVLSTFFWMLTMAAYVRCVEKPGRWRYLSALGLFALGLMTKPMLVTLPFVLLLLDVWPLGRLPMNNWAETRARALRLVREKIPFLVLVLASSAVTFVVQRNTGAVVPMETISLKLRVANAVLSYLQYFRKMLWPVNLAVFYPFDRLLPVAWVAIAALLVIGVTVLAIRVVRHAPYLTVGWLWYVGTLVPVIGLVQVGSHSIADRYTYIPLIGLFIVVAWGAPRLATRGRVRGPVLATAGAAVLSACAVGTWLQLRCWQNSETLFRHALQVTPNNHVAYNDLGLHLFQKGKADEAIAMYQQALRLAPNYADAHGNMGVALATRGDLTNALPHLTESVRLEPRNAEAHYNLGMLLVRLGQTEQAIPHLEKALQLDRNHARAHYNLGLALVKQNRFAEAIRHFETAARLRPDVAEVQSNLGLALGATGQFDQALAHLTQALRLNPNDPTAHYNLGVTLIRLGRLEDALAEVETAARLNPRFEQAQQAARDLRQELNKDRTP